MHLPTWVKRLLWNNNVGQLRRGSSNRHNPIDLYVMRLEERRVLSASAVLATLVAEPDASGATTEAVAQETSIIDDAAGVAIHDDDSISMSTPVVAVNIATIDATEPMVATPASMELVIDSPITDGDVVDAGLPFDDFHSAPLDTSDAPAHSPATEVIFIDSRVSDYQTLIDGVSNDAEVVILNADEDGIQQIADHLDDREDIAAIHIVSHGDSGALNLGSSTVTNENLDSYTNELNDIGASLTEGGDILFYGCNVGEGDRGTDFIEEIAEATDADVAASTDLTGASEQSGDWELELSTGQVETGVVFSASLQSDYAHVLKTFTVDTSDDTPDANLGDGLALDASGNTSLRAAVQEANVNTGEDLIVFDPTLAGQTIRLESEIEFTDSATTTLEGLGATQITISGDSVSDDVSGMDLDGLGDTRVFHVAPDADVTIGDVSITKGFDAVEGGGILVDVDGSLTLDGVTMSDNQATMGGALANYGHTEIWNNSSIIDNVATTNGGAIYTEGSGDIGVGATLIVTDSTIEDNTAEYDGGGIYAVDDHVELTNTTVSANHATMGSGGGVYTVSDSGDTLIVTRSTVSANTAGLNGGGIYAAEDDVSIVNSTVSGNSADGAGGGIYAAPSDSNIFSIVNSTITGNVAEATSTSPTSSGGGLYVTEGTAVLNNTIVAGNFKGTGMVTPSDIELGDNGEAGSIDTDNSFNNLIGDAATSGGLSHDADGDPNLGNNNAVGNGGSGTIDVSTVLDTMLADNGGSTQTHALVASGPAVNAGSNSRATTPGDDGIPGTSGMGDTGESSLTTDQRDAPFARVVGGTVDIGAFEMSVLINEVDADTPGSDEAEFVELYDGGVGNTPLDGLVLVFYNGNGDVSYRAIDLDEQTTNADGFFVIGNTNVANVGITFPDNTLQNGDSNGADAVALYFGDAADFPNGTAVTSASLVDAIVYDTDDADDSGLLDILTPGQPQRDEDDNGDKDFESNSRVPDGEGGPLVTSNYVAQTPTPGKSNISPDTFVTLDSGGNLLILDNSASGIDDNLKISVNAAGSILITDLSGNHAICTTVGGSTSGNGTSTLIVDASLVTGSIQVRTGGGDDSLTVDHSTGFIDFDITFTAGETGETNGDSIEVTGYDLNDADGVADVTVSHTGAEAGSVALAGHGTVFFSETEPLTLGGTAADLVINLPAGADATVVLSDDGGANDPDGTEDAGFSAIDGAFEFTEFANPTNSLTINDGTGVKTISIEGLDSAFDADLTIAEDDASKDNTVNFQFNPTDIGTGSLDAEANVINVDVAVSTSSTGTIDLRASRNIAMSSGSSLTTVDGGITLEANTTGTTSGTFTAIALNDSDITSTGGDISIEGRGGDTGSSNRGVDIFSGSRVRSLGIGQVVITGFGGDADANNDGLRVTNADTLISSVDGAIQLTGTGGSGTGDSNQGLRIEDGANVVSSGNATITVMGFGGTGGDFQGGVVIRDVNTSIESTTGAIQITGTAGTGGLLSEGIGMFTGARVESLGTGATAATIDIVGVGGSGTAGAHGVRLQGTDVIVRSKDGKITIDGEGGSGASNEGVALFGGTNVISTGTAEILLDGEGGDGGSNNAGVIVGGSGTTVTTKTGLLTIMGIGGNGSGADSIFNSGVTISSEAVVSSTGTDPQAANIVIMGTGGEGDLENYGVRVRDAGTAVSAIDGDIMITGIAGIDADTGSGMGLFNTGVEIDFDGKVETTGTDGNITIDGTAGAVGSSGSGVDVGLGGIVKAADGDISITGTGDGTGTGNAGVAVYSVGTVEVGSDGTIEVIGDVDSGSQGVGVYVGQAGSAIRTTGTGGISLTGSGGDTGSGNHGIMVEMGALIESTIATATISQIELLGTAGGSDGVLITGAGSSISSVTMDIEMVGDVAAGETGRGIHMADGAKVESTGATVASAATISIDGTGQGAVDAEGVLIEDAATRVSAVAGTVTIIGSDSDATPDSDNVVFDAATLETATGDITVTALQTDLRMDNAARILSDEADAFLNAANDVLLGIVDVDNDGSSAAGAVIVTADADTTADARGVSPNEVGKVLDNLAAETANIIAAQASLQAATGIGDAAVDDNDIDIAAMELAATTVAGDVSISDDGGLVITTIGGLSGVSITDSGADGDILIREGVAGSGTEDDFYVSAAVNNEGSGDITLFADGDDHTDDLGLFADITSAQDGDIFLISANDIHIESTAPLVATMGGTIEVHAGRRFVFGGSLTLGLADGDVETVDYAGPLTNQIVPVAQYLDTPGAFGAAYDPLTVNTDTGESGLVWIRNGGLTTLSSLRPFNTFTAAELAAFPTVDGVIQIPAASGITPLTTPAAPASEGEIEHLQALGFDVNTGQIVIHQGGETPLAAFDPVTGANVTTLATSIPDFTLHIDGLDVDDAGNVYFSPEPGIVPLKNSYKNGVIFLDGTNPAQTDISGVSAGSTITRWAGIEETGELGSIFTVAEVDMGVGPVGRTIATYDSEGNLIAVDPDGSPFAVRLEDLAFDGNFLYGPDIGAEGVPSTVFVFEIVGPGGTRQGFNSGGGKILVTATDNLEAPLLDAGTGTVYLIADSDDNGEGAVTNGTANGPSIIAAAASIRAGEGIGELGEALELQVDTLAAHTTFGVINVHNTQDLQVGTVPECSFPLFGEVEELSGVTTYGGDIKIAASGAIGSTSKGAIRSDGMYGGDGQDAGEILIHSTAVGDINLDAEVSADGGDAGDNGNGGGVGGNAGVITIKSETSDVNVNDVSSRGGMGDGEGDDGEDGLVQLVAPIGAVDQDPGTAILAGELKVKAYGSVDLLNANDVDRLAGVVTGVGNHFFYNDVDDVHIDKIDDQMVLCGKVICEVEGVTTVGGDIKITAGGPITSEQDAGRVMSDGADGGSDGGEDGDGGSAGEILLHAVGPINLDAKVSADGGDAADDGYGGGAGEWYEGYGGGVGGNAGVITIKSETSDVNIHDVSSRGGMGDGEGDDGEDGLVQLVAPFGAVDQDPGTAILAGGLKVKAYGSVDLLNANDVDRLAGVVTGVGNHFFFNDVDDVHIDKIDDQMVLCGKVICEVEGVTTVGGDIKITADGPITSEENVGTVMSDGADGGSDGGEDGDGGSAGEILLHAVGPINLDAKVSADGGDAADDGYGGGAGEWYEGYGGGVGGNAGVITIKSETSDVNIHDVSSRGGLGDGEGDDGEGGLVQLVAPLGAVDQDSGTAILVEMGSLKIIAGGDAILAEANNVYTLAAKVGGAFDFNDVDLLRIGNVTEHTFCGVTIEEVDGITGGGEKISLTMQDLVIAAGVVNEGGLRLQNGDSGATIGLGTGAGSLSITQAEAAWIQVEVLEIGRNDEGNAAGTITVDGLILAPDYVPTLVLITGAEVKGAGDSTTDVMVANLGILSATGVDISADADVLAVVNSDSGVVKVADVDDITVGTVMTCTDPIVGISNSDVVQLETGGKLTIGQDFDLADGPDGQDIDAPEAKVILISDGGVEELDGSTIITSKLLVTVITPNGDGAATGDFLLEQDNEVDVLATATTGGLFKFNNVGELLVGTIEDCLGISHAGINSDGNIVQLVTGGPLTIGLEDGEDITAIGSKVILNSSGGVIESEDSIIVTRELLVLGSGGEFLFDNINMVEILAAETTGGQFSFVTSSDDLLIGTIADCDGNDIVGVNSGDNEVNLVNIGGSISQDVGDLVAVVASAFTVEAAGSIDLDTTVVSVIASASATGSITLDETDNIVLVSIVTFDGDIIVSAGGEIVAVLVEANSDIFLDSGDSLFIDSVSANDGGRVTATAGDGIREVVFDVDGSFEEVDDGAPDIYAASLVAEAGNGFATDDNPIETVLAGSAGLLEIHGGMGGVFVINTGDLILLDLDPSIGPDDTAVSATNGDIEIEVQSKLKVDGDVASDGNDDITFTATHGGVGGDIEFTENAHIYTGNGEYEGEVDEVDGVITGTAAGSLIIHREATFQTETGQVSGDSYPEQNVPARPMEDFVEILTPTDFGAETDVDSLGQTFLVVRFLDDFASTPGETGENYEFFIDWDGPDFDANEIEQYPVEDLPESVSTLLAGPVFRLPSGDTAQRINGDDGSGTTQLVFFKQFNGNPDPNNPAANVQTTATVFMDFRPPGTNSPTANGIRLSGGGVQITLEQPLSLTVPGEGLFSSVVVSESSVDAPASRDEQVAVADDAAALPPTQESVADLGVAVIELETDADVEEFFYKVWDTTKQKPGEEKIGLRIEWLDDTETLFKYFKSLDSDKFEIYYKPIGVNQAFPVYRLHISEHKIVPWDLDIGSDAENLDALPAEFRSFRESFQKAIEDNAGDADEAAAPNADPNDQVVPQAEGELMPEDVKAFDARKYEGGTAEDATEPEEADGVSLLPRLDDEMGEYSITRPLVASATAAVAGLAAARSKGQWKKRVNEAMEQEDYSLTKAARWCRRIVGRS